MKTVMVALLVACSQPLFLPVPTSPPPQLDTVAPAIDVPIHAEATYTSLVDHDPRLDRACEELAYLTAHGGEPTNDLATTILRMHGIAEPLQRVLVDVPDDQFGDDQWRPNASIGHGTFEAKTVAILIFRPNLAIAPFPRAISADTELAFTLDPALSNPVVTVADASGLVRLPITESRVTVPCHHHASERYITLEATDPRRAATAMMIFPIYCKLHAPTTLQAEPSINVQGLGKAPGSVERRLATILDRERVAAGLPPLVRDPRVERAASAYARDRAEQRHTDQTKLMREAGLLAPASSWTTFHADSLDGAINRIVNSTEELDKLRDQDRTSFGVGATQVADGWWISILYITIPPPIDSRRAAVLIANAIRGTDQDAMIDQAASDFAQRYADGLAAGWSRSDLEPRAIAAMKNKLGHADVTVDKRVELLVDPRALVGKHQFKYFGVGVAQSARDGALVGTIWIVVLFA
jgi:hypothetical protein